MKKLFLCAVLGLALSPAFCAVSTTATAAAPATRTAPAAKAEATLSPERARKALVGVWVSTQRTAVVAPGTMTLSDKGKVTLAPEGFDPLQGTYKVQGRFIDIKTDHGAAALIYELNKDALSVQYENGAFQSFTRQTPAAASSAAPAKLKEKK
jgi:hypothetical protein